MHTDFALSAVEEILPDLAKVRTGPALVDERPPWQERKLYQRHCSLLL
jgi:hypothetical protein